MNTEIIQFPLPVAEREIAEHKYRGDPIMLETLRHAWATQNSLDADIRAWSHPAKSDVVEILDWLASVGRSAPTPYDYRRHARALAAALLFKITDGVPHHMASRIVNDDKWTPEQARDYWRCVAICSAAWQEGAV